MLHLTRYFHLNAATAKIVDKPELWPYSSYKEYIEPDKVANKICDFDQILDIKPEEYKRFVNDQIGYQRELALIKHLLIDDYSG